MDGVLVGVDDLDAHFERATAGAWILTEPETGGAGRQYRVEASRATGFMFAQV